MKKTKRKCILIIVVFSTLLIFSSFDAVISSTDAEVQDQVVTFLTEVAGFNEDSFSFSSFNISRNSLLGSNIPNTGISAILSANNQNFSLTMDIVYGKVQFYRLRWQESPKFDTIISSEDSLDFVINSLKAYETNFGAAYINELMEMLPAKLSTQDSRIENQHNILEINYTNDSEIEPDYIKFSWSKKIDGVELQYGKLLMTMSKNGILTSFGDRTELYKIVVADEYISEEQALSLGNKHINEYAQENNRKIISIESEFQYCRDVNNKREDGFTIFPEWIITAEFSEVSKEGIYGYIVHIWADTGEVYDIGTQAKFMELVDETSSNSMYLIILIGTISGAAISIVTIYKHKRKNITKSIGKNTAAVAGIFFILSLSTCQVCKASPSLIYGSRASLTQEEIDLDTLMSWNIANSSIYAGYTTYNWYGASTTASNLYIGAYGHDSDFSISFYIGHGLKAGPAGYWCINGWPPHTHNCVGMMDDSGNYVRDEDIYTNSINENPDSTKVVIFWSCHLGEDAMGSIISYPCGDKAHAMPLSWNHDTGLTSTGYTSPDNSNQVFIGFIGEAPQLHAPLWGWDDTCYWFLSYFYWATLCDNQNINAALDYTSQEMFEVNDFSDTDLYQGYDMLNLQGQMVVYGEGDMYI